jgi:hypothetical protein
MRCRGSWGSRSAETSLRPIGLAARFFGHPRLEAGGSKPALDGGSGGAEPTGPQLSEHGWAAFPLFELVGPQSVADPPVHLLKPLLRPGDPEVTEPAVQIDGERLDDFGEAAPTRSTRELTHPILHGLKGLRRHQWLRLGIVTDRQRKAEEWSRGRRSHRTLRFVDAEMEPAEEHHQRAHDALAGYLRPHEHAQVIRIADERVAALLQLLVDFVEEHVRK